MRPKLKMTQLQILTKCFDRLGVSYNEHVIPVGDESVLSILTISDGINGIELYFEDDEFDHLELPAER
jgi:hypothetical protein